jgi:Asp-tRNA(Asn)/Glu-tRNA(Gln) amidotransferase A subunit family amidase
MARSARDLRLLLSIIGESPIPAHAPPADLRGLKVALWLDEPTFPLDADTKATLETLPSVSKQQAQSWIKLRVRSALNG